MTQTKDKFDIFLSLYAHDSGPIVDKVDAFLENCYRDNHDENLVNHDDENDENDNNDNNDGNVVENNNGDKIDGRLLRRSMIIDGCNTFEDGTFEIICRINHSCLPNVLICPNGTIKTLTYIPKNKEIVWNFIDDKYLYKPFYIRQKQIFDNLGFVCQCKRCQNDCDINTTDDTRIFKCLKCNMDSICVTYNCNDKHQTQNDHDIIVGDPSSNLNNINEEEEEKKHPHDEKKMDDDNYHTVFLKCYHCGWVPNETDINLKYLEMEHKCHNFESKQIRNIVIASQVNSKLLVQFINDTIRFIHEEVLVYLSKQHFEFFDFLRFLIEDIDYLRKCMQNGKSTSKREDELVDNFELKILLLAHESGNLIYDPSNSITTVMFDINKKLLCNITKENDIKLAVQMVKDKTKTKNSTSCDGVTLNFNVVRKVISYVKKGEKSFGVDNSTVEYY